MKPDLYKFGGDCKKLDLKQYLSGEHCVPVLLPYEIGIF